MRRSIPARVSTPAERNAAEKFFDGLLASVGFDVVPLYTYEPEETIFGCRNCGTYLLTVDSKGRSKFVPYKKEKS